jgi:hypoxanthine phosphoribosyltransferase
MLRIKDKDFEVFIKNNQIQKRVMELGAQISSDFENKEPVFLPILNGAFLFAGDLIKEISINCEVSFIKTQSYSGTESTGSVKKLIGLDLELKGRHVILVDDIVDTGLTMYSLIEEIKNHLPASIHIITLLLKPEALQKELEIKYVGFTIPTKFVVGYGLDYDRLGRNLKDIYQIIK